MGSLTLEDPWLAAALSDGTVALLNTEVAMRQRHHGRTTSGSSTPRRLFQLPGGAAYCADLADQWLVAGSGGFISTALVCSSPKDVYRASSQMLIVSNVVYLCTAGSK